MSGPTLYYFRPSEFREWWDDMDPRLLVLLDVFRHRWARPVAISPHPRALGRRGMPASSGSDHNFDRWGRVLAADVMPVGLVTRTDAERAIELARECGFTSIALYPHWQPRPGLHLGARPSAHPEVPALWGATRDADGRQVYGSLDAALGAMPEEA